MPVGEVAAPPAPRRKKNTPQQQQTQQHARSPCGSEEAPNPPRPAPPPRRPAAYPEVASCVRSPQAAESRQAPSAGHWRALGPRRRTARPALGPPPARAPSRPSLAAACAYACARAAASRAERFFAPTASRAPGRAPAPTASVPRWLTAAHTDVDIRQHGAPRPHASRGRLTPARAVAPARGPPPPHPPAHPGVPSPPSFVLPAICMRII